MRRLEDLRTDIYLLISKHTKAESNRTFESPRYNGDMCFVGRYIFFGLHLHIRYEYKKFIVPQVKEGIKKKFHSAIILKNT